MTIEQANEYFSSLPEGFASAEELRAALTADVQKVQFVGVAGTAGKTAAAGLLAYPAGGGVPRRLLPRRL